MNYTDEAYIKLVANAISENVKQIDFNEINQERMIELCKKHKTVALVWVGMKKLNNLPEDYAKIFESGFKLEVIDYVNKTKFLDELSKAISNKGIKHIQLKGRTVGKYYLQEELRRFGDIDLLIAKEDSQKVKNIIEKFGFKHYYDQSNSNVDYFQKKKTVIELHSKIVTGMHFSKSERYKTFTEDAYANSVVVSDCLHELDFETSFIYNVYHTAKHFYEGGCGIRMIVDLWLMKKATDNESYNNILGVLEELGLKKFTVKLLDLGDKWFGSSNKEIEDIGEIQNYIITSGIYGHGNVNDDVRQMRKNNKNFFFLNMLNWMFPNYKEMRECCKWFKNKPAVLLPVAYFVRGYENVKERGGIIKTGKGIFKGKNQNNKLDNILDIMGLNNE